MKSRIRRYTFGDPGGCFGCTMACRDDCTMNCAKYCTAGPGLMSVDRPMYDDEKNKKSKQNLRGSEKSFHQLLRNYVASTGIQRIRRISKIVS